MGTEATAFAHVYFALLCFALFRSFDPTRSDVRIFKSARKKETNPSISVLMSDPYRRRLMASLTLTSVRVI